MKKLLGFTIFWLVSILSVAIGVLWYTGDGEIFGTKEKSSNETQVISHMEKLEEIAVLGLSVTDIYDKSQVSTFLGKDIPFSEKTSYLKGTFDAKLGFDGRNVEIKYLNNNTYEVHVPEFIVVGIQNPDFIVVDNKGEIFSFATEDIDTHKMANKAMSNKTLTKYIDLNEEWLQDQTTNYYEKKLREQDPEAKLKMIFGEKVS